jgi:hypothetical protein
MSTPLATTTCAGVTRGNAIRLFPFNVSRAIIPAFVQRAVGSNDSTLTRISKSPVNPSCAKSKESLADQISSPPPSNVYDPASAFGVIDPVAPPPTWSNVKAAPSIRLSPTLTNITTITTRKNIVRI